MKKNGKMPVRGLSLVIALIMGLATTALAGGAGNTKIDSFNESKKLLLGKVYYDHRTTLYCNSEFDQSKTVHFGKEFTPVKSSLNRAPRLEWEHMVPAEAFGKSFSEWRDGASVCVDKRGKPFKGRKCAEKASEEFRLMESDMYNLYPESGQVNGLRSNYSYAMLSGPADFEFGACQTRISSRDRKIEPRPEIRGDIASNYFYMDAAYPGHGIISDKNRKLFEAWDKQDPVDAWECERAKRIERIQGNTQFVVRDACGKAGLW